MLEVVILTITAHSDIFVDYYTHQLYGHFTLSRLDLTLFCCGKHDRSYWDIYRTDCVLWKSRRIVPKNNAFLGRGDDSIRRMWSPFDHDIRRNFDAH